MEDLCTGASASPRQRALNKKCSWPDSHVTGEAGSSGDNTWQPGQHRDTGSVEMRSGYASVRDIQHGAPYSEGGLETSSN